jgi:hypothetical protein
MSALPGLCQDGDDGLQGSGSDGPALLDTDIGFSGLLLGMTREAALEQAKNSDLIQAPPERDVEFFPVEERQILTLSAQPEVPFIYLQFVRDVLYSITLIFDDARIDYLDLTQQLERTYGPHTRLDPDSRWWELGRVTIRAEKPAVVKYIALEDFVEASGFEGEQPDGRKERILQGL